MSRQCKRPDRLSARGIATVEFALMLLPLVLLLAFPLLFGRIFYQYEIARKAAHDAARYMASVPQADIKSPVRAPMEAAFAEAMAAAATAALDQPPTITVQCAGNPCIGTLPTTVRVLIQLRLDDPVFKQLTGDVTGDFGLLLDADVRMPYVGQ